MERILIGAMGTARFDGAEYLFPNGNSEISSYFIHALGVINNPDKVIILLTKEAKEQQWEGKDGLKSWFEDSLSNTELIPIDIEKGGSESEAWQIFEKIAAAIPQDAEVIVDITNGLRSIPILLLSAVRYLQTVKKVRITDIYYCAFDTVAREENTKPVYPLSLFNILLDWTNAVDVFVRSGNSVLLAEQLKRPEFADLGKEWQEIAEILTELSISLDLMRLESVLRASARLDKVLKTLSETALPDAAKPFLYVLNQLRKEFSRFAMEDTRNPQRVNIFLSKTLDLIVWYQEHQRYAESILLAREWFISWAIMKSGQKNVFRYQDRQAYADDLNQEARGKETNNKFNLSSSDFETWRDLTHVRNEVGHPISEKLISPDKLKQDIQAVILKLKRLQR